MTNLTMLQDEFSELALPTNLSVDVVDAWEEFNREGIGEWATPGSFRQYHIFSDTVSIWIMRKVYRDGEAGFWVDFGSNPESKDEYTAKQAVELIKRYLESFG